VTALSIIVPVLDEAAGITATLSALAPLRAAGHQVIVVDGGSRDGTPRWPPRWPMPCCPASAAALAR
jgi:hypothetical protein